MKKLIKIFLFRGWMMAVTSCLLILSTTSCFTGVEGTKKITLSKDDKKALQSFPEDKFFNSITGTPISEWEPGKKFIAADNRALLIFEQQGMPLDPEAVALGGKTIIFSGTEERLNPDGTKNLVLLFSDENLVYRYNTGKNVSSASTELDSDQIPMLIDEAMINKSRELLKGKKLWTRSPLWYDDKGDRIQGRKFVPVTIVDVQPGTLVFPLKVKFTAEDGRQAWAYMNFGNSSSESRAFANLFYLSDLRKNFPTITDEVWRLICDGKIANGMTKTECKLSLGNPSEVDAGHDYSQTLDLWHYPDGKVLWFEDGLLTRFRQ